MVKAVGAGGFAIVVPAPAIAETVFVALVGARGFVDVVPELAGSLTRVWAEILGATRLIRGTSLVEIAALPEPVPETAVGVVPSVIELLNMFAPGVVEFAIADKADDGDGDNGVATNDGRERADCPEIAYGMDGEVLEGKAVDPPLFWPTDPGVGLTDERGDAEAVADPVGTARETLAVDAVALPGVDAVALPAIGVALAEIGAVAAALGGGAMTWAAIVAGLI
jgi:hypothetical protein